jgi:hypothetical protein
MGELKKQDFNLVNIYRIFSIINKNTFITEFADEGKKHCSHFFTIWCELQFTMILLDWLQSDGRRGSNGTEQLHTRVSHQTEATTFKGSQKRHSGRIFA